MLKVALIQLNTGNEIGPAVEIASGLIRQAASEGATFISTPETTHLMQLGREAVFAKAHYQQNDPGLAAFCALAAELGVWLHIGSLIIKVAEDKLANRAFVIGPAGMIVAEYDKLHLFDVDLPNGESYRESNLYQCGDQAVVVKTPFGALGLSICYDVRFPYLYRGLAEAGADIILVPAAFTVKTGEAHWHTLLQARAIETGCFVLAAAQTGTHATGRNTFGHSLAIDPWGTILADSGTETGVTLVDLDLAKVAKTRQIVPSLQHTRNFDTKMIDLA